MSRDQLRRALVLNALGHPLNVAVATAVLVAGLMLGATWLVPVAVVCWFLLAGITFFDEREARRVGARVRRPPPVERPVRFAAEIGARVTAAGRASRGIHALDPPRGLADDVDTLVASIRADAARAQTIHDFLAEHPLDALKRRIRETSRAPLRSALESELAALTRLRQRQDALLDEMDRAVAALSTVHAEIVAADDDDRRALKCGLESHISDLDATSQRLQETFAETRAASQPL